MSTATHTLLSLDRRAALFACASLLAACGGGGSSSPAPIPAPPPFVFPTPDPTTRVSGTAGYTPGCDGGVVNNGTLYVEAEVEPTVTLNPASPGQLIGTWQQNRWSGGASQGIGVAYSVDGGATWTRSSTALSRCTGGTPANNGDYERVSDPWVSISPDGTSYLMTLAIGGGGTTSAMLVTRSTDHGQTWSNATPLIIDPAPYFNDKNSITADPQVTANAYAVWDRLGLSNNGPTMFTRTTDDGVTWSAARNIYDPGSNAQTIGNEIVVTSRGTLVNVATRIMLSGSGQVADLIALRSTDQGATWLAPPIKINNLLAVGAFNPQTHVAIRDGSDLPQAAAGPNGEIYVVWQDARGTNGQIDAVLLSKSIDDGLTWSQPVRVNTQAAVQAFTPRVHVRSSDGAVAVSYFDTRNDTSDANTLPTDYWLVRSTDGGITWSEAHIAGPFDLALAPNALGLFLGDYQGLTSSATGFLSFFVQTTRDGAVNRTDVFRQDIPLTGPGPFAAKMRASTVAAAPPDASFRTRVSDRIDLVRASRNRAAR